MARRDNAHSRLVGWLKLGLPLAALALLSTLFMVARTLDPDDALPYAQVDIEELLRDPRLTAPSFSGMTRQGDEIAFTAETAHTRSDGVTGARAVKPVLRLIAPDGATTEVHADQAVMRPDENRMVLSGGVEIATSTGYRLQSAELLAKLDQTALESREPVTASAPMTEISADSMLLARDTRDAPEVLVFKGTVRLIYQPPKDSPPEDAPAPAPDAPKVPE